MSVKKEKSSSISVIKRSKKSINLETKLDILHRFDAGEKAVDIARALGLAPTTVRTIRDRDGNKIKEAAKSATPSNAKTTTRMRSALMMKMESLLSVWIENEVAQGNSLQKNIIKSKAKSLFNELKNEQKYDGAAGTSANDQDETFEASQGWFERFKVRANLYNNSLTGAGTSAVSFSVDLFHDELKAVIDDGGYSAKQIFNVDETRLFWKRLPNETYITKLEKCAPGFEASKDRLTLLLGGNAEGDFKFQPLLVYHSENPSALKDISKDRLPVHWRSNKKGCMTSALFKDWVLTCAIPEMQAYCAKENLYFKTLILLRNASCYPVYLNDLFENVKFLFLPPDTTSLIQPMDQGVISTFKSYYLLRTCKQLLSTPDVQNKTTMLEFWNTFNINHAIKNISDSWNEVKSSCMNGVWRKIWPECVHDMYGVDSKIDDLPSVRLEIANMAREFNIEGMDESDIDQLLASYNEEMRNEELIQMCLETDHAELIGIEEVPMQHNLTSKRLSEALQLIDEAIEIFENDDPDSERSAKVARMLTHDINCYKEMYMDRKKESVQLTLDKYFNIVYINKMDE